MLIIYFKSDGEIYQVVSPYKTMEEFYGKRAEEFNLILDSIYIEDYNDYIFNRYPEFIIKDKQLKFKNNDMQKILGL